MAPPVTGTLVGREAGIGKTSLVEAVVDHAAASGAVVRRGQAHPFERTRPCGPVADALDPRRRSADPRRAAVARWLVHDADGSPSARGALGDQRHQVVEEILDVVEHSFRDHVREVHGVDLAQAMPPPEQVLDTGPSRPPGPAHGWFSR